MNNNNKKSKTIGIYPTDKDFLINYKNNCGNNCSDIESFHHFINDFLQKKNLINNLNEALDDKNLLIFNLQKKIEELNEKNNFLNNKIHEINNEKNNLINNASNKETKFNFKQYYDKIPKEFKAYLKNKNNNDNEKKILKEKKFEKMELIYKNEKEIKTKDYKKKILICILFSFFLDTKNHNLDFFDIFEDLKNFNFYPLLF